MRYRLLYKTYKFGPFYTSEIELSDLAKAWLAISAAFAIMLTVVLPGGLSGLLSFNFLVLFAFSALTVGLGFLLHELGHKFVAQRYGCLAEFRANPLMLLLALAISFFGIVIAAPGAVLIAGRPVSRAENGHISIAGPLINIGLAFAFLALHLVAGTGSGLAQLGLYGFRINSWIGLFNLIPVGFFDGAKIWGWSKAAWSAAVIVSFYLAFILPAML